jgi:hypothetical protein
MYQIIFVPTQCQTEPDAKKKHFLSLSVAEFIDPWLESCRIGPQAQGAWRAGTTMNYKDTEPYVGFSLKLTR